MAIADRINEMYTHVRDVYDTITNVDLPTNKNIENIPSTIRKSYLDIMNNGIDTIYDNWEKVNGTGTSLTLNNTEEAPMTIEYKGNTSQGENPTPTTPQDIHIVSGDNSIMVSNSDNTQSASYPIYLPVENYLPNNATTQTINGITYTINEDKSIKINGTASGRADIYLYGSNTDTGSYTYIPKGTYTIDTSNLLDGTMFLQFREKTAGVVYQTKQNNGLLTLLSQQDCYFYGIMLAVESGKTINNLTFYPQIEKGTKLNSYTPYGTTPIELCKIGTYQDRIFKSSGKNLFDDIVRQGVTTYDGGVYSYNATRLTSTNWITLKAGTYTINAKTNTSKTLQISNITFDTNDNFYNISGVSGIWKTLPFTFTTPIDIKWKYNFDYSDNSNITVNEINSIILNEGSTALPYEPYGKDWYLNKQIGKVVLGSTSYSRLITNYSNVEYIEINKPSNFLGYNSYDKVEIKCDKATWMATTTDGWDNAQNIGKISGNAHNLCWWMGFPKNTGIDNIKTQLEDAIVYYALATPTYEKITGELLNQLEAIKKSYENQTNINQENNDLPFELEVGALEKY